MRLQNIYLVLIQQKHITVKNLIIQRNLFTQKKNTRETENRLNYKNIKKSQIIYHHSSLKNRMYEYNTQKFPSLKIFVIQYLGVARGLNFNSKRERREKLQGVKVSTT